MSKKILTSILCRPWPVLTVALLLSALSIFYTAKKLEFLTGRDDLMPRNAQFQKDYQAYRASFGDQEEIAIVIEGDDPALVSRFSDALYTKLAVEKRLFLDIMYPGGMQYFRKNGLLFMPLEQLERMTTTFELAAPVLKALAASPSIQTLFTSLTSGIDSYLARPTPQQLKSLAFMLGALDKGFSGFDGKRSALSMDSFLSGSPDGKPSMIESAGRQQVITIRPLKESDSFVPAEKAIKKARAELSSLLLKPEFRGVTAGMTGVPLLEYEEMSTSMSDMEKASVLSFILTVILLLFAFKGLRNTVAAMISLVVAIAVAFGVATLLVGHLNILSMAFAVMLLGLGVEYGIRVVLRHQELLSGMPYEEALLEALVSNLKPVFFAFSTTAFAFLTFLFTDFKGIAELGLIAAAGVFICFVTTFTVMPAMMVVMQKKGAGEERQEQVQGVVTLFAKPWLIVAATVILCLLGAAALPRVPFDFNMLNLQAKGLESVRYAYKLMKSKENSGYFAVSMAKDRDEAVRLAARFEKLPVVDHVVSLPALVPDRQDEKLALIGRMKAAFEGITPVPYEENLRVMELPAVFEGFRERVEKLKNRLESDRAKEVKPVAAFLATLDKFFAGLEKEKDRNALNMLRDMQAEMFAPLPEKLGMLKASLDASKVTEADIPEQLKKKFQGADGRLLLQIAPKKEIFDEKPLAEFVNAVKSVDPHATGEPVSVYESFKILKSSYLNAFLYALGGVVVIMLLSFRNIKSALLGVAPLSAGLLMMVGGMWLFGLRFNVANIIVMPLLLGVGIDSAIYIISRHLKGQETPAQVATSSAGKGVLLNALTILFSFGALMVAHHQGVFSIGAVMSLGMTTIVLAFLLFLPALLIITGKK